MLWKILLFASHIHCFWCLATYELGVEGEALNGYYITLGIGQPMQNVKLVVDTGSANLAVAVVPPTAGSANFFHHSNSRTFQTTNSTVDLKYIQGGWSGFLGSDLVNVGENHTFRCALSCMTSIRNVFDVNSKFAGILGLAYPAISKPNSSVLPFFDAFRREVRMTDIFSLALCGPFFSEPHSGTLCGKLHLGFVSTRNYLNDIIYTPIIRERMYEITLTMIKVGSEGIATDCDELNAPLAYIDTGATQLSLSSALFHRIVSSIKKQVTDKMADKYENADKFWRNETAACIPKKYFEISDFPDLSVSLYHTDNSSFDLIVSPEIYLLRLDGGTSMEETCFLLGIGQSDVGTIIGSTILKGYYVVFDRSNKRIGFANSSLLQTGLKLKSFVTTPYSMTDRSYCKHAMASIPAGTVILLIFVLMLTVLVLYKIILWIRAIRQSDNHSDTSSLVGKDYRM